MIQSKLPVAVGSPEIVNRFDELVLIVTPFVPVGESVVCPPLTVKLLSAAIALFIVVVPEFAPRLIAVAAPPIFKVVAPVLKRLPVVVVVESVPPLIAALPAAVKLPVVVTLPLLATVNLVTPEADALSISSFSS